MIYFLNLKKLPIHIFTQSYTLHIGNSESHTSMHVCSCVLPLKYVQLPKPYRILPLKLYSNSDFAGAIVV